MGLPLPAGVVKMVMGFAPSRRDTGFTETYYVKPAAINQANLDTVADAMVAARRGILATDSELLWVRFSLPQAGVFRSTYKKTYNLDGQFDTPAGVVTLPPEVVALTRWEAIGIATPTFLFSMHYVGCIPESALRADGTQLAWLSIGPFGPWQTAALAFNAAILANLVMVNKVTTGGVPALVYRTPTSVDFTDLRSRDRGRPLSVWHGLHGH